MVAAAHEVEVAFDAMASACAVRLVAPARMDARALAQAAIAEVRRIEAAYSRYRPDSIIGRINAAAGAGWQELDAETAGLFDYAHTLHAASGGLFDVTSGLLRRAWDFRQPRVPDAATLAPLLDLVGWDKVQRDGTRLRLPLAGMEVDFGGFGKEYAADRAAAALAALGVRHGYVNLGGDLRVIGPRADGSAWAIAIQDPRAPERTVASLPIASGALATSGDYERFFDLDGRRYCHILSPKSGMPVARWRSVSVLAPVAIAAGSYATIAMLKQDDAIDFLDASGLAYLAIDRDGAQYSRDATGSAI
jgi:thiamine biosynthesis lipoprotein